MNCCFAAFLALLFASITVSSACLAQPIVETRVLVRYADLDLSTPEGMKALNCRIEKAANRVCPDASGPSPGGAGGSGLQGRCLGRGPWPGSSSDCRTAAEPIGRGRCGRSPLIEILKPGD